jgi:GH35 family endo-1,4-beta-xylanase
MSRVLAVAVALAALSLAPAPATAQTDAGKDKYLGSISLFTDPLFKQYFNQVIPENAGKWGSAAGTTRTAPMRWTGLDQAYNFAKANGFPFNFHVLLWGNQQPAWMASLPPDQQLPEIKKWYAAVAERYPDIDWLQVVNEATWDPPSCDSPKNQGSSCADSGNYVNALGGANGTDGTGWDWVLNAFRLARQYFPHTKLMINDVLITGQDVDTTRYLDIIRILQREHLIDGIGLQAHAFEFIPGASGPTIPGRPWVAEPDMAVHKANLDRLAATGLPIMVTELDLDGLASGAVPGDEVQLADYRRVFPVFWAHPAVIGATLWGWKQPSHWRNAQNAPIVLQNGTPKPAALWLSNYVKGIAPVIRPGQQFAVTDVNTVGTVQADDWASQLGRPNLRTFTWTIAGGSGAGLFGIEPSTGKLSVADARRVDEHTTYSLNVRVSDGFHTSEEVPVSVVTGELANVDHAPVGATVPATLSISLAGSAGFGAFIPGLAKDYEATAAATVTSTAGNATLTITDPAAASPGRLVNGAFALAQPVQAATTGAYAPIGPAPLTVQSYSGPTANDPVALHFKQAIGASEPLRTGQYSKTMVLTVSTTEP